MSYILCVLGGAALGVVITLIIKRPKPAEGYFKVVPVSVEDSVYSVNVCLKPDQNLLKANTLVLQRDPSQK